MTAQKDRITHLLSEIGAAWAVREDKCILPDDGFDAKPTYHVHPDASEPHVNYIQRFTSLKELEAWIAEHKPPGKRKRSIPSSWRRVNVSLPAAQIKALRQQNGSLQASIERLAKEELE